MSDKCKSDSIFFFHGVVLIVIVMILGHNCEQKKDRQRLLDEQTAKLTKLVQAGDQAIDDRLVQVGTWLKENSSDCKVASVQTEKDGQEKIQVVCVSSDAVPDRYTCTPDVKVEEDE